MGLWDKVKFGATVVGIFTGGVILQQIHDAYRDSKKWVENMLIDEDSDEGADEH